MVDTGKTLLNKCLAPLSRPKSRHSFVYVATSELVPFVRRLRPVLACHDGVNLGRSFCRTELRSSGTVGHFTDGDVAYVVKLAGWSGASTSGVNFRLCGWHLP